MILKYSNQWQSKVFIIMINLISHTNKTLKITVRNSIKYLQVHVDLTRVIIIIFIKSLA